MNTKKDNSHDQIELRSEKTRDIIGTSPPILIRWGITIIAIFFSALILVVLLAPYPCGNGETIFQYLFFT